MATFSQEETDQMIKAFKEMGVKPDLEDTESFKHWLQNFGDSESDKGSASVLYSPKISITCDVINAGWICTATLTPIG